jgi:hypothetical protein
MINDRIFIWEHILYITIADYDHDMNIFIQFVQKKTIQITLSSNTITFQSAIFIEKILSTYFMWYVFKSLIPMKTDIISRVLLFKIVQLENNNVWF